MVKSGVDIVDGGSDVGMRDEFVYFINPARQICPKCGAIGSIMRYRDGMRVKNIRTCASCGCWVAYSIKRDGEKTPVRGYVNTKEANEMEGIEEEEEEEEEFKIVDKGRSDMDTVKSMLKDFKRKVDNRIFHENVAEIKMEFKGGKVYMEVLKFYKEEI